jgi:transposase
MKLKPVYNIPNDYGRRIYMNKKAFTEEEIKELMDNPNIIKVTPNAITYLPEFKVKAVLSYIGGTSPSEIFRENGISLDLLGTDIPRKRLFQWKKIYDEQGELGLLFNKRGSGRKKSNNPKELSVEEKLKRAEARIKLLEAENDFLKKLEELERQAMKKKRY